MTDNEKEIMQEQIEKMALKIAKLEEESATYFNFVSELSTELGEIKLSKIMIRLHGGPIMCIHQIRSLTSIFSASSRRFASVSHLAPTCWSWLAR